MKVLVSLASAWLLVSSLHGADTPALSQKQLDHLFQEAIMLMQVGLYDEAETRLKKILSQMPDQPTVRKLMQEIQEKRKLTGKPDPSAELKKTLESIVLPEVDFREASLQDVIAFLREESKKHTKDKTEINFVVMLPEGKAPVITLSLRKIPMMELLRYISMLTGLQYKVDPHAVVFSPAPKLAPVQSDANAP